MNCCIYLRKSRADEELEKQGINTLSKHKEILLELAKKNNYNVVKIFEEVVSGESLRARLEAQQMLSEVEQGLYDAVLVMEIERLARGDTIDQGIIAQTFKYSNTKIITPLKIYDPNNEYDEEYFEFGLFMSRREYKTINRRLQTGKLASVKKGAYIGSIAPYGYERIKTKEGYTLAINEEEAKIVKFIFERTLKGIGPGKIAQELNAMGTKPRKSKFWTAACVRKIPENVVYKGYIHWNKRKHIKKIIDGEIVISRPTQKDYLLVKGLHEPIIDEETFDKAQAIINTRRTPKLTKMQILKNPLSGLVKCGECGYYMQRKPDYRGEFLYCHVTGCKTRSSKLDVIEKEIIENLKIYLDKKNIILTKEEEQTKEKLNVSLNIDIIEKEIEKTKKQLENVYDAFEEGVYDSDTFIKRKKLAEDKLKQLNDKKEEMLKTNTSSQEELKTKIVNLRNLLDKYDIMNIEEKNKLLKAIISEVVYTRKPKQKDFDIEIITKI